MAKKSEICSVQKVVLKLGVHDEKQKTKALKAVTSLAGIESLSIDMNAKKLTVVGEADPVEIVGKLKKSCHTELLTVGPAKEPDKKKKKKKKKKDEPPNFEELWKNCYQHPHPPIYISSEEDPNSRLIS